MPFILALLAVFTPRIVIILLWLLSDWFEGVFATLLWPLLGFFLLPTTTLWFSAVENWFGGEWTFVAVLGMILSVALDLSPTGYRRRRVVVE